MSDQYGNTVDNEVWVPCYQRHEPMPGVHQDIPHTQCVTPSKENTMNAAHIARVCHEANRALQIIQGDPAPSPAWEDAPRWQTDSAIEGVLKALDGATPEDLHQSWCDFKEADGWIFGDVKDAEAKTHPCLVPYADLPEDQRIKDGLFKTIVGALTA